MVQRVRSVLTGVTGSPYYSNHYFEDVADPEECVGRVKAFWDLFAGVMVNEIDVHVDGNVPIISESSLEITGAAAVDGQDTAGTSSGEMLPPATQLVVSWHTGVYAGGREVIGKTFIPALSVDVNDEGVVLGSYRSDQIDALADWVSDNPPLFVLSRAHHLSSQVVFANLWTQFGILRSRRD